MIWNAIIDLCDQCVRETSPADACTALLGIDSAIADMSVAALPEEEWADVSLCSSNAKEVRKGKNMYEGISIGLSRLRVMAMKAEEIDVSADEVGEIIEVSSGDRD